MQFETYLDFQVDFLSFVQVVSFIHISFEQKFHDICMIEKEKGTTDEGLHPTLLVYLKVI